MQVITISPDGAVSGLQVKPGRGLDLTKLGRAQVQRASEIVWDEDHQAWKIDVLQEAGRGVVTYRKLRDAGVEGRPLRRMCPSGMAFKNRKRGEPAVFFANSYDEAVKVEIAYLDALRLKGQF